jgi:hypothetical protein
MTAFEMAIQLDGNYEVAKLASCHLESYSTRVSHGDDELAAGRAGQATCTSPRVCLTSQSHTGIHARPRVISGMRGDRRKSGIA